MYFYTTLIQGVASGGYLAQSQAFKFYPIATTSQLAEGEHVSETLFAFRSRRDSSKEDESLRTD